MPRYQTAREAWYAVSHERIEQFSKTVADLFRRNGWVWATLPPCQHGIPSWEDIQATVLSLGYECVREVEKAETVDPDRRDLSNACSTGRLQVRLRRNRQNYWTAVVELVPFSLESL